MLFITDARTSGPLRLGSCLAAVLGLGLGLGCGLRSTPFEVEGGWWASDVSLFDRGTCEEPIVLANIDATVNGQLAGEDGVRGYCGEPGPEDVYLLRPPTDTDVTIAFDPAVTEIDATIRVARGTCDGATSGNTVLCDANVFANGGPDPRTFFARANNDYFVIVEADDLDERGEYGFRVAFGEPALSVCHAHPEVIRQLPGSTFRWTNDFSEGFGFVDGSCGGPGKENMFPLDATGPGFAFIQATGTGGYWPVISVRTSCSARSEQICSAAPSGSRSAAVDFFIPSAGRYYVVIDSASVSAGGYSLEIFFE